MRSFRAWLEDRLGRGRLRREIAEEMEHHLELEAEKLTAEGHHPAEARRLARVRFGAMDATLDDAQRMHGAAWLEDGARDLALAARGIRRRPGLAAGVAVTLALGVGSSALVFAAVSGVLLDRRPYPAADALAFVWRTVPGTEDRLRVPGPDAAEIGSVEGVADVAFLAGVSGRSLARMGAPAVPLVAGVVSANWFDVLGVQAALGRGFVAADGVETAPAVWLLDDRFFRARLGADSSIIGRPLELDGLAGVVVGVLPPAFRLVLPPGLGYPLRVDAWQPIRGPLSSLRRPDREEDQDSDATGVVVVRHADDGTPGRVQAGLDALAARLRAEVPAYADAGYGLAARPLARDAVAEARPVLSALFAAVLLVLVLATANAAGLLLTRVVARSRELAVRTALGARRGRLVRQIVAEHTVLALSGALPGVLLAWLALPALEARLTGLAPHVALSLDARVVGLAALAVVIAVAATSAAVLFDPALRSSAAAALVVRGATTGGRSAHRLRSALVALQVAISLALVVGAGVMVRTAARLADQDLGFRAADGLAFRVSLAFPDRYRGPAERAALVGELESRIAALPGVEAVGVVGGLPLADPEFTQPWTGPDDPPGTPRGERANYRVVSAGFFDAMDTRVIAGRAFRPEDDRQDRRVVIVDARLAEQLAPAGDAVGTSLRVPVDGEVVQATVVGVVENVRFESPARPGRATIYVPYRHEASRRIAFVVRTRGAPEALIRPIEETLARMDARIAMHGATPLVTVVENALRPTRDVMIALGAFGVAALLLALVALHAGVAGAIARRTAEIGVRRALGATEGRVTVEALRDGLVPCAAGMGLGALLVIAGTPTLRSLVYGVSPLDPVAVGTAVVIVGAACIGAGWLAARRAARVAPGAALSAE